jgi:hypothetical protein
MLQNGTYKGVNYFKGDRPPDRRKKNGNKRSRSWQVNEIWELHAEISRRILLGQKNTVIAEALKCSVQTVSNVRNSPVIQDRLSLMRGARDASAIDIARDIQEFAPEALALLKQVVRGEGPGENASIALRAKQANEFLDRAGFSAVRKEQHIHAHLTSEEIEGIKQRALELRKDKDKSEVIDAEYSTSAAVGAGGG